MNLILGDCIEKMRELPENSIDAIITDPPYGLEFMGKDWDGYGTPKGYENWCVAWATEALRVLKEGGFMFAFGGTRTYHRLTCGIEDAGFQIRDCIAWTYASGFPKAQDLGKIVDKQYKKKQEYYDLAKYLKNAREKKNLSQKDIAKHFPSKTGGITGCVWNWENAVNVPTKEQWEKLREILDFEHEWDWLIQEETKRYEEAEREVIGKDGRKAKESIFGIGIQKEWDITKSATQEAKHLIGWKTPALKPAYEPIVVAQKPIKGTIADNMLKNNVGGYNVDECRIPYESEGDRQGCKVGFGEQNEKSGVYELGHGEIKQGDMTQGRFPPNLLSEDEVLDDGRDVPAGGNVKGTEQSTPALNCYGEYKRKKWESHNDSGSFNRYFSLDAWWNKQLKTLPKEAQKTFPFLYCPKAGKSEKNEGCNGIEERQAVGGGGITSPKREDGSIIVSGDKGCAGKYGSAKAKARNNHPTVKPIKINTYLIKLATMEGATILDPFMGSGTTGIACWLTNRNFIGIEQSEEYMRIAEARIGHYSKQQKLNGEMEAKP